MSESVDYLPWDNEKELINIRDESFHVVSRSSSFNSHSNPNLAAAEGDSIPLQQDGCPIQAIEKTGPISKSCDDLSHKSFKPYSFSRSQSCLSLNSNLGGKYSHVQSKIKIYIEGFKQSGLKQTLKQITPTTRASKEEYLEEINNRLMKELEEKNATLLQLQENYEHLLLKYAEAQNKIDNLRFQSSGNEGEYPSGRRHKSKLFLKNVGKPPLYSYKNPTTPEYRWTIGKVNRSFEAEAKIDRPSTLAVDATLRVNDKDALKAVTPTDSEGVSSVVTSMSGHSKILTNFEEKDADVQNKPVALKSEVLEKSLPVNNSFDKVKHWQNSLPPLEMIETPDTALYDLKSADQIPSLSTMYNELPTSELENIPETSEWFGQSKQMSQLGMKKYLRTLSLPSSLTRRNIMSQIYKKRNNHTIDLSSPTHADSVNSFHSIVAPDCLTVSALSPTTDKETINASDGILRRRKKPPFFRSASLPVYDYESPRSMRRCAVPPLDLDNLTFSEDETCPATKSNILTCSSFLTSHDCSNQTLNSLNSCKAAVSDFSPTSLTFQGQATIHKSTSITPDRSKAFLHHGVRDDMSCNVCGEILLSGKAASLHSIYTKEGSGKPAICKSHSFSIEGTSPSSALTSLGSNDPPEPFDVFANNLKARSQITLKALTAHVNYS